MGQFAQQTNAAAAATHIVEEIACDSGAKSQQFSSSLPDTVDAKLLLACSGADAQTLQRDRDRNAEMTLTQLTEEGVPFVVNAKTVRDS